MNVLSLFDGISSFEEAKKYFDKISLL